MFDIGARFLILFGLIVLLVLGLTLQEVETQVADASFVVEVEAGYLYDSTVAGMVRGDRNVHENIDQQNTFELGKEINLAL